MSLCQQKYRLLHAPLNRKILQSHTKAEAAVSEQPFLLLVNMRQRIADGVKNKTRLIMMEALAVLQRCHCDGKF